jgi:hypothetical protein
MHQNNNPPTKTWLHVAILLLTTQILSTNAVETVWITVKLPAPTPTVPLPPSYTSPSEFQNSVMQVTNEYRACHNASPLVWNDTLADYSRKWAEACIWKHSVCIGIHNKKQETGTPRKAMLISRQYGRYGENLAYGFANASAAVIAWGEERDMYDFALPTGFSEKTGHFTQLVWKATTQVGCAAVNCGYSNAKRDVEGVPEDGLEGKVAAPRFSADDEVEGDGLNMVKRSEPRAQGWYVVCEYMPPGNVVGQHDVYFKKNVLPKKATVSEVLGSASTSTLSSSEGATITSASKTSPSTNAATSSIMGRQSEATGGAKRFGLDSMLGMLLVALGAVGIGTVLYA